MSDNSVVETQAVETTRKTKALLLQDYVMELLGFDTCMICQVNHAGASVRAQNELALLNQRV